MAMQHIRREHGTREQGDQHTPVQATASPHGGLRGRLMATMHGLGNFWTKINNDWILNLSALLAYNILMSVFPILLVLLAIAGFFLNAISPGSLASLENHIQSAVPGGSGLFGAKSLKNLGNSAGLVFIIGVVVSLFTGSRLFITMENCFGIIFRLRGRDVIHQNLMAIGMLLIYAVLVPLMFLASTLSTAIGGAIFPHAGGFALFLIQAAGVVTGFVVACIFFGVIYVVVPNRPVEWREVWRGTLVAAALFVLYEILFPFYKSRLLKPGNYGSLAGFAIVILTFFYYTGFILLLGAEVNSWALGQRQTMGDLNALIHEVQAHNTTRGVAGPTAGTVQEDMQNHKGEEAMSTPERAVEHERIDHHTHAEPPKYAEAGAPGPEQAAPQTPQGQEETHQAEQETQRHHHYGPPLGQRHGDRQGEQQDEQDTSTRETEDQRHPVGSA